MGQEITSIEAAHDWLSRQTSHQLRPGFDRMRHALSLLGQPQASLPSIIQLAGTNGKGSTLAYLQGLFISQGLRVGPFPRPISWPSTSDSWLAASPLRMRNYWNWSVLWWSLMKN